MASLPVPRSIFLTVDATTAGTWTRILPRLYCNGTIHSIVINRTVGSAATCDLRIAYEQNTSDPVDAIYIVNSAAIAPLFTDVLDPAQVFDGNRKDGLWLYLDPASDTTYEIRIDMNLNQN
jgi:hypothetical protein